MSATNDAASVPPAYVEPGENPITRAEGDNVPDDFKYSDIVAECTVDIRHRFLQRVYLLLSLQLAATVAISAGFMSHPSWGAWVAQHSWSVWVTMLSSLGSMLGAMVMRRNYPWNLLFLSLFTVGESAIIGLTTSMFDTAVVLNAFAITIVVFVGLTVFATQTKYDFTGWYPYMGALLWGLLGLGLVMIFSNSSTVELAYSFIAVVLFSGFILADTQMIMNRFYPEDEIAATIELYLDILNLFLNILRILSNSDNN